MQSLPPELIREVLQEVGSLSDLASVAQVCQYLHALAIPWLYRHTTIDLQRVYTQKNGTSRADGPYPSCMAQLQGLARNSQGQCQYVQRLSIVHKSDFEFRQHKFGQHAFLNKDVASILDERNGTQFFVNSLLETAIQSMRCLTEFEWTVFAYPSDAILIALSKHKLCSFTYQCPENHFTDAFLSLPLAPTSRINPDSRVHKMGNLSSLTLSNIGNDKVADDAAALVFSLRHQLRVLRLGLLPDWSPNCHYNFSLDSEQDGLSMEYQFARENDRLFPVIYHFIMASESEPMKLEELELQYISDRFNYQDWIQAFDFHTIQRFTLISGRFYFDDAFKELWTYLREQNVSFKGLKTDCENIPMDSFVESFDGLESLILYDSDKRWSRLSSLTLAGHFHSLRKFFYPDNVYGFAFHENDGLREIIANCPLLEELGIYMLGESMEEAFMLFDKSPSLRRLYVTRWTIRENPDVDLDAEEFLWKFFSYFGRRNSPFFNRLEVLSYNHALWEIVPTELDDCEREEMEYELSYEALSDGELDALGPDQTIGDHMEIDEGGSIDTPDDRTGGEVDPDPLRWLLQPEGYTWERSLSGFSRMPLSVPWMNYRDDEMARTVHGFVRTRGYMVEKPLLRAKPPRWRDDWADSSDSDSAEFYVGGGSEDEEDGEDREGEGVEEMI
ncbi:hypothetical protein FQN54_004713 [Arachnomyces sp. PD_36]|nr:hypothetical protein FQN54_004713 [Arachnomyces sp. PD_36]